MAVGYPITRLEARLSAVNVAQDPCEILENDCFVEDFPPKIGEVMFVVREGIKVASGFVFDEYVKEIDKKQRWKVRKS